MTILQTEPHNPLIDGVQFFLLIHKIMIDIHHYHQVDENYSHHQCHRETPSKYVKCRVYTIAINTPEAILFSIAA